MSEKFTDSQISEIVEAASAAPSVHNSQPWQFEAAGGELRLHGVPERALRVADPEGRALYVSCGAALFNARLAARIAGLETDVSLLPHPDYPLDVLAVLRVRARRVPTAPERSLYESIWRRHTSRRPYSSRQIPRVLMAGLQKSAEAEDARLRLLDRRDTSSVLGLAARAGQELAASPAHQGELSRWIGDGGVDGIPSWALPGRPQHKPSPVRDGDFLAVGRPVSGTRAAYERNPHLTALTTEHDEPEDWLRAGQALQHVLLVATLNGLSASFLYQLIERDDMREGAERSWPWPEHLQMIIRFGYSQEVLPTPRRSPAEVMAPTADIRLTWPA
ncbi:MAG TPA: nitroreductase family protein [Streptosporangiaceae bacterium]|jgi:Nitroreductase family|nr:nitroreductase family protein [Streptosporangiaceae bacterium]